MSETTVQPDDDLSAEDRKTIIDGLISYNDEQGFVWKREPVNVVARDEEGRVVGGLLSEVNLGWLFVYALWVDSAVRHSGIGSRLIRTAEARARERGCIGMHLDTYSFQARPFYEGLGFEVYGELADLPPGGAKYYLYKRFDE